MIALDTSALVWAVKGDGADDDTCRLRLEKIQSMGQIMIPAPAMAEYLHGIDSSKHAESIVLVRGFAVLPPFDYRCALECARILRDRPAKRSTPRQAFKVDAMIVAVSIVHGADTIVVKDADFRSIAGGRIEIVEASTLKVEQNLPFAEAKRLRPS